MTRLGRAAPPWWSTLLAAVLAALVLAAPANAGEQDSSITQSCNAGDSDSDGGSGDSDSSGSCGNQDRIVRQSAGGDASRSITQRQSFGDDDRVRVRRDRDDDRDRERDDAEFESTEASVSEETEECEDFASQGDAQAALEEGEADGSALDADGDGRACEEEFTQEVSGAPEGGIETGGGGTLARSEAGPGTAAQVARVAGPPIALALLAAGLIGLRRGRSA